MIKYVQKKILDLSLYEKYLLDSSETNQFTNNGPAKKNLESVLQDLLEIDSDKSVICVSNGTLALHSLYLFLNKKSEKKYVSPSFTFPSCNVGGFSIDIKDINFDNYSISRDLISEYDCFILTCLFGSYPDDLLEWQDKCKTENKTLILDVASSPLTKINGKNICNYGDYSFGSLHHTKYLGFGEGGFLVVPSEEYTEINQSLGFGFSPKHKHREYEKNSSNYKMSDITAAAIIQHIKKYDIKKHIKTQKEILNTVSQFSFVKPFDYKDGVVYGNFPLVFDFPIDKDFFQDRGVEAQKYYYPLLKHKNSLELYSKILNLPLHNDITKEDIKKYENILKDLERAYEPS